MPIFFISEMCLLCCITENYFGMNSSMFLLTITDHVVLFILLQTLSQEINFVWIKKNHTAFYLFILLLMWPCITCLIMAVLFVYWWIFLISFTPTAKWQVMCDLNFSYKKSAAIGIKKTIPLYIKATNTHFKNGK